MPNREQRLLLRERASGAYGTASYFTATVAFDFVPMRVLPAALFALTTYWMIGLRPGLGRAATFLLLLVLTNLTGAAMNMAIGALQRVYVRVQAKTGLRRHIGPRLDDVPAVGADQPDGRRHEHGHRCVLIVVRLHLHTSALLR